jgi:outer membrane lipoprotein-sorting protein
MPWKPRAIGLRTTEPQKGVKPMNAKNLFMMAALLALTVGAAQAQDTPTGEEIVQRSIEASGGEEAQNAVKTWYSEAEMEIVGMGLTGTIQAWQSRPSKSYTLMKLPGIGEIIQCSDGTNVWEVNPMTGPRVYEGEEKEFMLFSSRFDTSSVDGFFDEVENEGEEDIDGEACYKVRMTSSAVGDMITWFSKESGLGRRTEMTMESQMGTITVQMDMLEYTEAHGLKLPKKILQSTMGQKISMVFTKYEGNADIPEDRFEPTAEIKALLENASKD